MPSPKEVMPTYQYECQACNHEFEELQTMMDKKLTKCPKCGKNKLARLIGSGSGMIFKGSGFYQTDYKNKPAPVGDSKPADKAETKPTTTTSATTPAKGSCGTGCGCHPK